MSEKPRIVIDTQVFVRAAINDRSLPAKLIYDLNQSYQLLVSRQIRNEVEDVLNRGNVRAKFKQITDNVVQRALTLYDAAEWIEVEDIPPISRDPKDDVFLATAVAGDADYLVSEDQDLLTLNPYQEIKIVNVLDIVVLLQPPAGEGEE